MKHFTRILLSVMVMVILFAGICFAANSDTYSLYRSKTHAFEIFYPTEWKVTEGYMGTIVIFSSTQENSSDKFRENIAVGVGDLANYPDTTLNKFVDSNLMQLSRVITDFKLIQRDNLNISGVPASTIVFEGRQGIFEITWKQAYLINNNKGYVVTFTAEQSQFRKYEATADRIINSFVTAKPTRL